MNKLYKEVKDGICSIPKEVTREEVEVQRRKYKNGEKHEHIFGEDTYATSGWYERECVICGHVDYI